MQEEQLGSLDRKVRRHKAQASGKKALQGSGESAATPPPSLLALMRNQFLLAAVSVGVAFNLFANFGSFIEFAKLLGDLAQTWHLWVHKFWHVIFGLFHIRVGPLESAQLTSGVFFLAPIIAVSLLDPEAGKDASDYRAYPLHGIAPFAVLYAAFKIPYVKALGAQETVVGNVDLFILSGFLSIAAVTLGAWKSMRNPAYAKRLWRIVGILVVLFAVNYSLIAVEVLYEFVRQGPVITR